MSRLRLAEKGPPPVLRPLDDFDVHRHSQELRDKWTAAVTWMRSREPSIWLLDSKVGRK